MVVTLARYRIGIHLLDGAGSVKCYSQTATRLLCSSPTNHGSCVLVLDIPKTGAVTGRMVCGRRLPGRKPKYAWTWDVHLNIDKTTRWYGDQLIGVVS